MIAAGVVELQFRGIAFPAGAASSKPANADESPFGGAKRTLPILATNG